MKTITIQIGNSDDKLTQREWSQLVSDVGLLIEHTAVTVHFFGSAPAHERWQNAAWVIVCTSDQASWLRHEVAKIRRAYSQGSAAWTDGETSFI